MQDLDSDLGSVFIYFYLEHFTSGVYTISWVFDIIGLPHVYLT